MAAEKRGGADRSMDARREEVRMRKQEAAQERRRIANMKREQAVKDKESKRKVREAHGGAGITVMFYEKAPPKTRSGRCSREIEFEAPKKTGRKRR